MPQRNNRRIALQQLRARLTTRIAVHLFRFWWRRQLPQDLDISNESMPVEGGRIRLRIYQPRGAGPFPVLHFFHGGGWVFGDLDSHDPLCRDLCTRSRHVVIAVDYRLAPRHPFPIPVQDSLASLEWTKNNAARFGGDPQRITLCGDSAGGNLAAVVAQQARHLHPGLVQGQVLIYPATSHYSHTQWPTYQSQGYRKNSLSYASLLKLWEAYLLDSPLWPPGTRSHELATPLHTEDVQGLPRALVLIAGQDVLYDEGAAYAERLQQAGTATELRRYPDQPHGFIGGKPSPAHHQAVADIAAWLST